MAGTQATAQGAEIEERRENGIAWLGFGVPPEHRLTAKLCADIFDAVERAEADPSVSCIVLLGAGGVFSNGDAPEDMESLALELPSLPDVAALCLRVERCKTPVIAALEGAAIGTGAELALAAHYRVAAPATRFCLPGQNLGLPPRAGASQRLPRLIGAGPALDILLSGALVSLGETPHEALCDRIAVGPIDEEVRAFCAELRAEGLGPRPSSQRTEGFSDAAGYLRAVAARRAQVAREPNPARRDIVAAVEAAQLLPFAAGLAFEADAFEQCWTSEAGRALRACAAAERAAEDAIPRAVTHGGRVAVLGGGPLAAPLVQGLLDAGVEVDWGCDSTEVLHAGVIALHAHFDAAAEAAAPTPLEHLRVGTAAEMAASAPIVLLAGPGQREVPIAAGACRVVAYPGRVSGIGLRIAPTPHAPRLVEVIAGPQARDEQLQDVEALALRLARIVLPVRSRGESIGGRLFDALCRAADALVDLGEEPWEIDAACRAWGWRSGPFLRRDVLGLDRLGAQQRHAGAENWASVLAAAGRRGRSDGGGFYDWDAPGRPAPSSAARDILAGRRAGASARSGAQLRELLLAALANEGARMLASGMARSAGDIDLVALQVLDLPRWRGGVMHAASEIGADRLGERLAGLAHPDRGFWAPHAAWAQLPAKGGDWAAAVAAGARQRDAG